MAKSKGLTLREQAEMSDELRRLKAFRKNAGARAAANKGEIEQAAFTAMGGAAAGYVDGLQQKMINEGQDNKFQIVEDVPTEGIGSALLIMYGVFGKKASKMRKRALSFGSGGMAYTLGSYAREAALKED